jgi:hypothetical protein
MNIGLGYYIITLWLNTHLLQKIFLPPIFPSFLLFALFLQANLNF